MLITDANIVLWGASPRILPDHALRLSDERIERIGPSDRLQQDYPKTRRRDATRKFLTPRNICAHTHFCGAFADMILVDSHSPTPVNAGKLPWRTLFGFEPGMVTATIVAGKLLIEDRLLTTLDEVEIKAGERELSRRVWTRDEEQFRV